VSLQDNAVKEEAPLWKLL